MDDLAARVRRVMRVGETRKVSALAKSLRAKAGDIVDCVYYSEGLDLIVGFRTGAGFAEFAPSQWEIERYE